MGEKLDAALYYAERYGFELLPAPVTGEKKPIGLGGPDFANATSDLVELQKHWLTHPNANIIRRVSGSLVIDVESEEGHAKEAEQARIEGKAFGIEALNELQAEKGRLPKTLAYNTWSDGLHLTYNPPSGFEDRKWKTKLAPGVELKSKGIVMMPPSARNGKRYHMLDNRNVADLPEDWAVFFVKERPNIEDWKRVRPRGSGSTICEEHGISMNDVLPLPGDALKVDGGYLIKHPIHGATGDGNLYINTSKNLWCCYHASCDNSGGDPVTWIAVREGFIRCDEAHGSLDKDTFKRVLDVLRRDGLVPANRPIVIEPDGTRLEIKIRGCNDIANAERFYDKYGKKVRYVTETGKFVEYDGKHWAEVSTTTIKHRAREVATIIQHEAAEAGRLTGRESNEQRKKKQAIADELTRWARQSSFKERIKAIVELFKGYVEISISMFDRNPLIFNCENGVYDIPTGVFTPDHNPDDYCMHIAGPYIKGATNAKWDAFKGKVQPSADVRAFLKRATGYSATALVNEEALFYLYGDGQAGKSTFVEAVRSALGSYGKAESFNTFLIKGDGSQNRPKPEILRLRGARFVRSIETNKNVRWDTALLNTFVSGEPYATRPLFSNNVVEVEPTFKLWYVSNHRVKADYDPEEESGFWRRLYPIPFNVVIPENEKDMGLKSYFMNDPDAKAAILAEILEGATEWYQASKGGTVPGLQAPKEIIAARYEYKAAQSPIYEFLKNECRIGDEYRVPIRDLWDVFSDARKGYNTNKVKSPVSLGLHLKGLGFGKDKVNNVRYATGLRLLQLDEEPYEVFSLSQVYK